MKNQKCQIGQSLIEFIYILPIFVIITVGFLDLGRALFYYSALSNAVREATRYSIVHRDLDDAEIKAKVIEFAFALQDTPNPLDPDNIDITYPTEENNINITISVEATYLFSPVTPGIQLLLGNLEGIPLIAQSTMRIAGASR